MSLCQSVWYFFPFAHWWLLRREKACMIVLWIYSSCAKSDKCKTRLKKKTPYPSRRLCFAMSHEPFIHTTDCPYLSEILVINSTSWIKTLLKPLHLLSSMYESHPLFNLRFHWSLHKNPVVSVFIFPLRCVTQRWLDVAVVLLLMAVALATIREMQDGAFQLLLIHHSFECLVSLLHYTQFSVAMSLYSVVLSVVCEYVSGAVFALWIDGRLSKAFVTDLQKLWQLTIVPLLHLERISSPWLFSLQTELCLTLCTKAYWQGHFLALVMSKTDASIGRISKISECM